MDRLITLPCRALISGIASLKAHIDHIEKAFDKRLDHIEQEIDK